MAISPDITGLPVLLQVQRTTSKTSRIDSCPRARRFKILDESRAHLVVSPVLHIYACSVLLLIFSDERPHQKTPFFSSQNLIIIYLCDGIRIVPQPSRNGQLGPYLFEGQPRILQSRRVTHPTSAKTTNPKA